MPIISQSFSRFEWNFVHGWDLLVWWSSHSSIHLVHPVLKGDEPTYMNSFKKTTTKNNPNHPPPPHQTNKKQNKQKTHTHIHTLLTVASFKPVWWWRPLSSTFLSEFAWPWPSFKVTVVWEKKNSGLHFLFLFLFLVANISIDLDEIRYVATTCWFVEALARFIFAQVIFKGETSADVILWNISTGTYGNRFGSNSVWCSTLLNPTVWCWYEWP